MKKVFLWIGLGAIMGFICTSLFQRTSMKLIHKTTGFVVAQEQGQSLQINDPFLEKELKLKGIAIPAPLRAQFDGKAVVRVGDPLFAKAFREVYLRINMGEGSYEWKDKA